MPDLPSELRQLDDHIAAQECLRGQLSDAIIDTTIAAIRAQRQAMAQAAQSVAVAGNNYGDINTGLIIQLAAKPGASKETFAAPIWRASLTKQTNCRYSSATAAMPKSGCRRSIPPCLPSMAGWKPSKDTPFAGLSQTPGE